MTRPRRAGHKYPVLRLTEIKLDLDHSEAALRNAILRALGIAEPELLGYRVRRRGYDARKSGEILFVYTLDAEVRDETALLEKFRHSHRIARAPDETYHYPVQAPADVSTRPVVIGTGPCGLFAGLSLARMGFRPILLERGKIVRERTQDVWGFWRGRQLNPESNVQFGEGGAGTFSDGKLHTGIKDRGHHIRRILQDFVDCGAPEEIIYISKPHIGTLRRDSLRQPRQVYRHRKRLGTRRDAQRRRSDRRRPCHSGRGAQRARHL
jgi:uncharacterized FAD-dependent dehydrogenase